MHSSPHQATDFLHVAVEFHHLVTHMQDVICGRRHFGGKTQCLHDVIHVYEVDNNVPNCDREAANGAYPVLEPRFRTQSVDVGGTDNGPGELATSCLSEAALAQVLGSRIHVEMARVLWLVLLSENVVRPTRSP
jgi:hypothetical protein